MYKLLMSDVHPKDYRAQLQQQQPLKAQKSLDHIQNNSRVTPNEMIVHKA
jgi:hypothetical protein